MVEISTKMDIVFEAVQFIKLSVVADNAVPVYNFLAVLLEKSNGMLMKSDIMSKDTMHSFGHTVFSLLCPRIVLSIPLNVVNLMSRPKGRLGVIGTISPYLK